MRECRAVLFDLDGTLLDTLEDLADAANYTLRTMGRRERSIEEIRAFVGNGARRLLELSLGEGSTAEEIERALDIFRPYYEENCRAKTAPYAGAVEAMRELSARGKKIAIVSNKPDEGVQRLVPLYFAGLVDLAVGERAGIRRKPAPDMVNAALETLGVTAQEAVYVGDSEVDVQTAKNAGTMFLAVSWGFRTRQQLVEAGAETIAETVEEMQALLV